MNYKLITLLWGLWVSVVLAIIVVQTINKKPKHPLAKTNFLKHKKQQKEGKLNEIYQQIKKNDGNHHHHANEGFNTMNKIEKLNKPQKRAIKSLLKNEHLKEFLVLKVKGIEKFYQESKKLEEKMMKIQEIHHEIEETLEEFSEMDIELKQRAQEWGITQDNVSFGLQWEKICYAHKENSNCLMCEEKFCENIGNKKNICPNKEVDKNHIIHFEDIFGTYVWKCANKNQELKDFEIVPDFNVCPLCKKQVVNVMIKIPLS